MGLIDAKTQQVAEHMGLVPRQLGPGEAEQASPVTFDPTVITAIFAAIAAAIVQVIQAVSNCNPSPTPPVPPLPTPPNLPQRGLLEADGPPQILVNPGPFQRVRLLLICRRAMRQQGVPFRALYLAPAMRDGMVATGQSTSAQEWQAVVTETAAMGADLAEYHP